MQTTIIGSQKWCNEWAEFYWNRAIKYADRSVKYNDDSLVIWAMLDMFMSYMWEDTKPWA